MRRQFIFYAIVTTYLLAFAPTYLWAEQNKEKLDLQSAKEMMITAGIEPKMAEIYSALATGQKLPGGNPCGTSAINSLQRDWKRVPGNLKMSLQALVTRPVKQKFRDFRNTFNPYSMGIRIHYDTSGSMMVPSHSVDAVGNYAFAALVYTYERDLGYNLPPSDTSGGTVNGIPMYDIYLDSLQVGLRGITVHEGQGMSYIVFNVFDNNIAPELTVAHELFHAVQMGYLGNLYAVWWMELTANWGAVQVFPASETNITGYGGNYFLSEPHLSLTYDNGSREYSAYLWAMYLSQRFGTDIIRRQIEILDSIIDSGFSSATDAVLLATDSSLKAHQTNLIDAFRTFTIWNYFTGSRYSQGIEGLRYTNGSNYENLVPEISVQSYPLQDTLESIEYLAGRYVRYDTIACRLHSRFDLTLASFPPPPCQPCVKTSFCPFDTIACCPPDVPVCSLSHNCPRWQRDARDSGCILGPDAPSINFSTSGGWRNSLLVFPKSGGLDTTSTLFTGDSGQSFVNFRDGVSKIVSIPINVQPEAESLRIKAVFVRLRGDMTNDCKMTPADWVRLQYWINNCAYIPLYPGMDDVNCDGLINYDDVYYLQNYIMSNGPFPCSLADPSTANHCPNGHMVDE